jgi:hypothetical protein
VHGSFNFCWRPCLIRQGSLRFSHCLRRQGEEARKRAGFLNFLQGSQVAGRGEAGMVPPISAGVPASRVRVPSVFHIAQGVRWRKRATCPRFLEGSPAARRGEACMVPPISAGAPASRVRYSYIFQIASSVKGRKRVGFLIFCRGPRWLVGGKRVWFLQFVQASLPHMSGFPPFLTLPQASGGGCV